MQPGPNDPYNQQPPPPPGGGGGYPPPGGGGYPPPGSGGGYGAGGYPQGGGNDNTLGLISMILGIVAIPLGCCWGAGSLFGIGAIVLGYLGKKKAAQGLASNRGQAQAGFICGIIAVVFGILWLILTVWTTTIDWTQYTNTN